MPSESGPQGRAQAAYSKALQFADKLFEALEDLDAAGGLDRAPGLDKPKARERTRAVFASARDGLNAQLAKLKAMGQRPAPRPRPPDRP